MMANQNKFVSLSEIGEELVRLGNILRSLDAGEDERGPLSQLEKKPYTAGTAKTQAKKAALDIVKVAEEIKSLTRSSAEPRLVQLSARELFSLGRQLGIRLDSKASKSDLVKRLLWMLFDSERGGEILRTLYQKDQEKDEKAMFESDVEWFDQHRQELVPQYQDQYVAILNRAVVDHDPGFEKLAERVYAKYGYRDFVMQKVKANAKPYRIVSPKLVSP